MTDATKPEENTFYPQYCFHLSPTINRWCHLRIADIWALRTHPGFQGQDVYFHLNHPIKWVRIAGVVVAVDERETRHFYTIDDGSGATLECVVNLPPKAPPAALAPGKPASEPSNAAPSSNNDARFPVVDGPIDVGHVLDIKGSVGTFRDSRQIRAEKIAHLRSTDQEVAFWEKVVRLRREVLDVPWALDPRVVRRCRREEEGRARGPDDAGHSRRRHRTNTGDKDVARTGLERRTKVTGSGTATAGLHSETGRTGLERRTKLTSSATVATLDSESRLGKAAGVDSESRKTGLERRRPAEPTSRRADSEKTTSLRTGLERKTRATATATTTGLGRSGVEKDRPGEPQGWAEFEKTASLTTGLERRTRATTTTPGLGRTGLENGRREEAQGRASRNEQTASPSGEIGTKTGLEKKPLAERPALVTGLERRRTTKQFTRLVPVTGKYDALGL
ncbi:hypothetical protein VTJ49DRAFT_3713 [Mycothermus thermophilus]|uniref:CST complex subunit STN1 n=1 Tax=Humicola insolens TaxID=85995 RepID=A0ABR3VM08_HUMIN